MNAGVILDAPSPRISTIACPYWFGARGDLDRFAHPGEAILPAFSEKSESSPELSDRRARWRR
jgi:hypothetical protein